MCSIVRNKQTSNLTHIQMSPSDTLARALCALEEGQHSKPHVYRGL